MSTDKVRSTKLKFKGEKTKKKRKRENGEEGRASGSKRNKDDDGDPETWVMPEDANEIRGPTFIIHPSDLSPICLNFNSTASRVILQPLDKVKSEEDSEVPTLLERIPTDVSQVWVTTRVAGSPTVNLRTGTGEGKFLSCDTHGLVSADRDARGPQEEWTPVLLPDGMVAFMNIYEKYLCVDEVAGGTLQLRGDSEEVGFKERFWVKIQYKYKKAANEEEKQKKDGIAVPQKIDEAGSKYVFSFLTRRLVSHIYSHMFQAWGAGRSITSVEDKKEVRIHLSLRTLPFLDNPPSVEARPQRGSLGRSDVGSSCETEKVLCLLLGLNGWTDYS